MKMLKEWTEQDHKKVNRALLRYFAGKVFINHRGENVLFSHSLERLETILGLPYTSSSSFAMLSLDCNVQIKLPHNTDFYYSHVGINEAGQVVLFLWDPEENEKIIIL